MSLVGYNAGLMLGHAWLRLLAVLLVYIIGATPSGARRLDAPPPDVELRTEVPHAARFECRDGPTCTAHVVPMVGDAGVPASTTWVVAIAWSTRIDQALFASSRTPESDARGRVLPRGPPRSPSRV